VVEVGCGTGQATRSLAQLGCSVIAVESGPDMAALARDRLAAFPNVAVETSSFEEWDDRARRFDVLVAAAAWHWVDPMFGWRRAHDTTCSVRRDGRHCSATSLSAGPASPRCTPRRLIFMSVIRPATPTGIIRPSRRRCARPTLAGGRPNDPPGGLFGPTVVRWYPTVQWFDGEGFADLLCSMSPYRRLDRDVREPLLDAIAERIRTRMGNRVSRRYLSVLRVGQRADGPGEYPQPEA